MIKQLAGGTDFHRAGRSTLLLLVLLLALPAQAVPGWARLAAGVEWRVHRLRDGRELYLTRWSPAQADLKLVQAADFGARKLGAEEFLQKSGALAVCNGGYFDAKDQAMGLLFDGRWRQPQVAGGSAFGGLFSLIGDTPRLDGVFQMSDADYAARKSDPGLRFMVQCGPRLLTQRQLVPGLEKGTVTRRTALGYDAEGRLTLLASGATSLLTFAELQSTVRDGLGWISGINLDGGSSTQSAVRGGAVNPGYSPVPFVLALRPRPR